MIDVSCVVLAKDVNKDFAVEELRVSSSNANDGSILISVGQARLLLNGGGLVAAVNNCLNKGR